MWTKSLLLFFIHFKNIHKCVVKASVSGLIQLTTVRTPRGLNEPQLPLLCRCFLQPQRSIQCNWTTKIKTVFQRALFPEVKNKVNCEHEIMIHTQCKCIAGSTNEALCHLHSATQRFSNFIAICKLVLFHRLLNLSFKWGGGAAALSGKAKTI